MNEFISHLNKIKMEKGKIMPFTQMVSQQDESQLCDNEVSEFSMLEKPLLMEQKKTNFEGEVVKYLKYLKKKKFEKIEEKEIENAKKDLKEWYVSFKIQQKKTIWENKFALNFDEKFLKSTDRDPDSIRQIFKTLQTKNEDQKKALEQMIDEIQDESKIEENYQLFRKLTIKQKVENEQIKEVDYKEQLKEFLKENPKEINLLQTVMKQEEIQNKIQNVKEAIGQYLESKYNPIELKLVANQWVFQDPNMIETNWKFYADHTFVSNKNRKPGQWQILENGQLFIKQKGGTTFDFENDSFKIQGDNLKELKVIKEEEPTVSMKIELLDIPNKLKELRDVVDGELFLQTNIILIVFQRICQENLSNQALKIRDVLKTSSSFGLQPLFNFFSESELCNFEHLQQNLSRAADILWHFKSDNMYRMQGVEDLFLLNFLQYQRDYYAILREGKQMYLKQVRIKDHEKIPIFSKDYKTQNEFFSQDDFFERRFVAFSDYEDLGILDLKTMETQEFKIETILPGYQKPQKSERQRFQFMVRNEQILIFWQKQIQIYDIKSKKLEEKIQPQGVFSNPILLSQNVICLENSKSLVFFKILGNFQKKLDYMSQIDIKDEQVRIESVDETSFCLVSENLIKLYKIEAETIKMEKEIQFENKLSKKVNFNSEIIAIENVNEYQKNYLYFDKNQIFKIPAKNFQVYKHKDMIINIQDKQQFGKDPIDFIYYYKLSQSGLQPMKTLESKGQALVFRSNFFVRTHKDGQYFQNLKSGLMTPYNGFLHLSSVDFDQKVIDIKIDTLGNVAVLTEDKVSIFDIQLKSKFEIKFEIELKDDEMERIEFGKYEGPIFYLITKQRAIMSIDYDNKLTPILEADENIKDVEFSPNMQWILITYKDQSLVLCSLTSKKMHKFNRCLRENSSPNDEEIYQVSFSQLISDKDQQQLLMVKNQSLHTILLGSETIKTVEVPNLKKIPYFHKDDENGFWKVAELNMKSEGQKFILIISYKGSLKIFDLQERTCQNHVSVIDSLALDKNMCEIDCFNNLICQSSEGLQNILDIDNALCQIVKPTQVVLQTRFRINSKYFGRQFQDTCMNPDKIFDYYTFNSQKVIHKNEKELRQSSRPSILIKELGCYSFFGFYVSNMFHKSKRVLGQNYHFEFPELMLNLLSYSQENQIIQIIEKESFEDLIKPQRAFANLNVMSLYALRINILSEIMNKHDNSNALAYYKQNKINMDIEQVIGWQEQLKMQKKLSKRQDYCNDKFEQANMTMQLMLDTIGKQNDSLSQNYLSSKLKMLDLGFIKFENFLNSDMVLQKWSLKALPSLQKNQQVMINQDDISRNIIDRFFDSYKEKRFNDFIYDIPNNLNQEFYDNQVALKSFCNQNLVKVDFYLMNMENLMTSEFVEKLYRTQGQQIFQTKFIQYYTYYAWNKDELDILWYDMLILTMFILLHVVNMQYIDMQKCAEDELECESKDSAFAIVGGRKNYFIQIIGLIETLICALFVLREIRAILTEKWQQYKEQLFWNINDILMPVSFIIGYIMDTESVAVPQSRFFYTVTTMSLLFMALKKLRLTERFSFMVICIFKSLYEITDYILFLFLVVLFLTVAYTNIGYVSPYSDKLNIYFANFIQMFKMAMGESQTDEILELDGGLYFSGWILFIFFAFFTTIVYMNILIAVVSDQFERIFESKDLELLKRRLPYTLKVSKKQINIRQCIIVVHEQDAEDSEWSGWISAFKKYISKANIQMIDKIDENQKETLGKMESKLQETNNLVVKNESQMQDIKEEINQIRDQIKNQNAKIDQVIQMLQK